MVPLFASFLLCMLIPMAVNADVCGGSSGPTCNASALYTEFETVYLGASTSDSPQELCVRLTRQENQAASIVIKFENGTQAGQDTQSYVYTSEPDKLIITFGSEPNTPHEVQIPYADSEACFVAKFTDASYGCRLWIRDEATTEQINACFAGLSQACTATAHDTWNEQACA
ncbi:uncharacterized protein LOC144145106 [Haemaphysalis longicornis]